MVDGIGLFVRCIVEFDSQLNLTYSFVDIYWTGKKTLWMQQKDVIKQKDTYERELRFKPWLDLNAGEYTCHVVIRATDNQIHVINKSIEVKSKYITSLSSVLCLPMLLPTMIVNISCTPGGSIWLLSLCRCYIILQALVNNVVVTVVTKIV